MEAAPTVPVTVGTLRVADATLHYQVRGEGPLVALVAAPMDADAYAPLADLLATDHTVLTADPRGINRSPLDDPNRDSTPELRADDLSRLLAHLDAGPAALLGSSGGAVTALALAQGHPGLVHTVIAHEPPLVELLDDREQLRAETADIIATHVAGDRVGAWRKFLAQANITLPEPVFEQMYAGELDPRHLADEHRFFNHELRATTGWQPDLAALREAKPRIVLGIGRESADQLCERTTTALGQALGIAPTRFPGGHVGFVEDPHGFAIRLREVLGGN
ncbi:alpha/beta fold hydrolase [Nonomuraea sp. NPDC050536]|uniref:alpha/beta fold hydrolase n=1 Tax=Nonomuraea sp. NPDC050536 TaxID=3364366 RepID=UPI0037C9B6C0